eukprot:EG_transcript_22274
MLSNAFKHGHPEHPDVQLIIHMEESRNNLLGMERPMCSPGQRAMQQPDAVGQGGDDAAARGGGLAAAVEQRPHRLREVGAFLSDALQQADIAILDQHLQFLDSSTTYTGTDLCRQLLGHGFRGLVCIRSGDDAPEDQALYTASGAHCSFGKDVPGAKLVQQLKTTYMLTIARPSAADAPARPTHAVHSPLPHTPPAHASPPPLLPWCAAVGCAPEVHASFCPL